MRVVRVGSMLVERGHILLLDDWVFDVSGEVLSDDPGSKLSLVCEPSSCFFSSAQEARRLLLRTRYRPSNLSALCSTPLRLRGGNQLEKVMPEERVTVADWKYTVINDGRGNLTALRNGEPWCRDLVGDNLVYWMFVEIRKLQAEREMVDTLLAMFKPSTEAKAEPSPERGTRAVGDQAMMAASDLEKLVAERLSVEMIRDAARATGYVTNSQAYEIADAVLAVLKVKT